MALKIRLKRMGNRNRPFYRLVVQESGWRRDGKTVADVGWYDAVKHPAQLSFKEKEIYKWLERGVQLTDTARTLLKRHGLLGKFKSGEYKEILNQEDTPANVRFTFAGEAIPEKPASVKAETPAGVPEAAAEEISEPKPPVEETSEPEAPKAEDSQADSDENTSLEAAAEPKEA